VDEVMLAVSPSAGASLVPESHLVVPPAGFFVAELPALSSDVAAWDLVLSTWKEQENSNIYDSKQNCWCSYLQITVLIITTIIQPLFSYLCATKASISKYLRKN
jgi:hypothetical protein